MEKNRRIEYEPPVQYACFFYNELKTITSKTGRSTGKTTTAAQIATLLMRASSKNNVVFARAEKSDLRDKMYSVVVSAIFDLHLENDFKFSVSPLRITCKTTGAICYFKGINGKTADDLTATKGFEPQGKTLALYFLDEANEVKSKEHILAAQETMAKFLLPNGTIFYAMNPAIRLNHWSHAFFDNIASQSSLDMSFYNIKMTWEDIRELLKPATIAMIETMRDNDPLHYRFVYLGEAISLEGRVIWSFDKDKHLIPLSTLQKRMRANIYYQPLKTFYGVDSGLKQDATAVSCWALYPDGKLIKLHTFWLDIKEYRKKTGKQGISHTDQAILMFEWYNAMRQELTQYGIIMTEPENEMWCFDGAAITQDLMLEWQKLTHFNCTPVTNKDIERDIARLVNGYTSGMLEILDLPANEPSLRELQNFCRDDNNEIPEGQSDHTIDADKYGTYVYITNYI